MKMTSLSAVLEEVETGEESLEKKSLVSDKASLDLEPLIQQILALDDEPAEEESQESITERQSHLQIWKEIEDEFETKRRAIEQYKESKELKADVPPNPDVDFLDQNVFPLLLKTLQETLIKAKELNCLKHQKSSFNGIDYIAETLWNLNPRHPERQKKRVYIFDMQWVKEWLQENPRPFFPFSYIWSREFAATKIQAAMRGHWVRRTDAVQEMRQFWKALAVEKESKNKSVGSIHSTQCN